MNLGPSIDSIDRNSRVLEVNPLEKFSVHLLKKLQFRKLSVAFFTGRPQTLKQSAVGPVSTKHISGRPERHQEGDLESRLISHEMTFR